MVARYDWETIRAEYEAGATMGELSRKHGVNKAAISRRAKKEGWIQDSSEVVARLADAKVNGLVNTVDPKKKAEAVDAAAERRAAVIREQREVWTGFREEIRAALEGNDFDRLRRLKLASESLRIVQDAERKAWSLDKTEAETPSVVRVHWMRGND